MLQFMGVLIMASVEFKGLNELMNYFKKAPNLAQTEDQNCKTLWINVSHRRTKKSAS